MKRLDRRTFLRRAAGTSVVAAGGASLLGLGEARAVAAGSTAAAEGVARRGRQGTSALADPAYTPLPLGSIRPRGWLQRQLRIQADGLSGHLDEFWPDVADSKCIRQGISPKGMSVWNSLPSVTAGSTT